MGFTFTDLAVAATTPLPSRDPPTTDASTAVVASDGGASDDCASDGGASEVDATKVDSPDNAKVTKTIFVGNVPLKVTTVKSSLKEFLKLFSPFGKIISYRFRSVAIDSKHKRAGFLNQKFNQDLKSTVNAYIVFDDLDLKVLELNGLKWHDHHLRIDDTSNPKSLLPLKSVFLGNLPLDVSEEEIWELFSEIGTVTNVRLVRDKISQIGKGFGFIEFSDKGSVSLALKKKFKIKDREIRITSMKRNGSSAEKRLKKKSKSVGKKSKSLDKKSFKKLFKREHVIGLVFVHGFLGSADSWENFPLDLLNTMKDGNNYRVYRFTLPSQGSYEKALVQLRNEIVLLSTQLDGLIFLCHSLGGLLVAQIFDKLEHDKVMGIIAFDSPYFGLSNDVSSVALSKTSQKVVDPVQQVASSVLKTTGYFAQGVVNVGYSIASSTKYVSSAVASSTSGAITQVSEITQSAYKSSSTFISNPKQVITSTASYIQELPGKTVNYMVEFPVRSWEVVGYTFDSGKIALNKVFYGENVLQEDIQNKSIKELEKDMVQGTQRPYTEDIKTPLVIQDEKDLGTSLFASPSDPWDSWIKLGLASVAIVSSGISYTTPVGFAKNLTRNLLLAHGVTALNEARKTIQFLYPPLWGDSVSSITSRMLNLADRIYFRCFYVKHDANTFINLPPSSLTCYFMPIETECTDILQGHMNLFSQTLNKDRYWTLVSLVEKEVKLILKKYYF